MTRKLEEIISTVSQRALKHWLSVKGLAHSAGNEKELHTLLTRLIEEDSLTLAELVEAVSGIEDYGGKRIYPRLLTDAKTFTSKKQFERHLSSLGLSLLAERTTIRLPAKPTLNYITWSDTEIRIKFSETHEHVKFDPETLTHNVTKRTKVILITFETESLFTKLCLDPPEIRNPHRMAASSGKVDPYENFYFAKTLEMLGGGALIPIDFPKIIEALVSTRPRLFRLPYDKLISADGLIQRNASQVDVRDHKIYELGVKEDGRDRVYEDLQGYWLPDQSEKQLRRELFMQLKRKEAMLRFLADCLPSEVNYAISRIRQLS